MRSPNGWVAGDWPLPCERLLFADVLVDAEKSEGNAHQEKEREQVAREKRRERDRKFQEAGRGKKIVDEGDSHHVQKTATQRGFAAVTAGCADGCCRRGRDAPLGQRLVTVGAVPEDVRYRFTAKRALSNTHLARSICQNGEARDTPMRQGYVAGESMSRIGTCKRARTGTTRQSPL
jgi:hypothetical protein